jgi:hypothetical protein
MAEGMCHVVVRYRSHFWVTPVFDRAGFLCRLPRGSRSTWRSAVATGRGSYGVANLALSVLHDD